MPVLSEEGYVDGGGNYCPVCESNDVEAHGIQADSDYAWCDCKCLSCGSTWQDTYELTGYRNLDEAEV